MPNALTDRTRMAAAEIAKYVTRHTYSAFGNVAGDWEESEIAAIITRNLADLIAEKDKRIAELEAIIQKQERRMRSLESDAEEYKERWKHSHDIDPFGGGEEW